jgi:hypothetical protein
MAADTAPVKIAKHAAVCAADGCRRLIEPGHYIVKVPGRGWRHQSCERPVRAPRVIR